MVLDADERFASPFGNRMYAWIGMKATLGGAAEYRQVGQHCLASRVHECLNVVVLADTNLFPGRFGLVRDIFDTGTGEDVTIGHEIPPVGSA